MLIFSLSFSRSFTLFWLSMPLFGRQPITLSAQQAAPSCDLDPGQELPKEWLCAGEGTVSALVDQV